MKCIELEYATCQSSEWTPKGALKVQPDALGVGGANEGAKSMQPLGLFARPSDPDKNGAAGALVGRRGDETFLAPQTDPRNSGTVPQGPKGSVTLYAPNPKLTSYLHLDGGAEEGKAYSQLLIKYGDKSLSLSFDTQADEPCITLRHGEGNGIVLTATGKVLIESPGGDNRYELDNTKHLFNGPAQFNGGMVVGGETGPAVATVQDLADLVVSINLTLAGLTSTAPGSPVTNSVPLVDIPPGSSKLAAAL